MRTSRAECAPVAGILFPHRRPPPTAGRASPPSSCAVIAAAAPRCPGPPESLLIEGEREIMKADRSGGACACMPCPAECQRGAAVACNHAPQDAALTRVPRAAEKIISTPPRLTAGNSAARCTVTAQATVPVNPPPALPRVPSCTPPRTCPALPLSSVARCVAGGCGKDLQQPQSACEVTNPLAVVRPAAPRPATSAAPPRNVPVQLHRRSPRLAQEKATGASPSPADLGYGSTRESEAGPAAPAGSPFTPSAGGNRSRQKPAKAAAQHHPRNLPGRSASAPPPHGRQSCEGGAASTAHTGAAVASGGQSRQRLSERADSRRGGASRPQGDRDNAREDQDRPSAEPEPHSSRPGTDAQGRLSEPVVAATLNTHGHTLCSRAHHLLAEAGAHVLCLTETMVLHDGSRAHHLRPQPGGGARASIVCAHVC